MCEHLLAQVLGKAIELGATELKILKSPKISSIGRSRLPHIGTDFVHGCWRRRDFDPGAEISFTQPSVCQIVFAGGFAKN